MTAHRDIHPPRPGLFMQGSPGHFRYQAISLCVLLSIAVLTPNIARSEQLQGFLPPDRFDLGLQDIGIQSVQESLNRSPTSVQYMVSELVDSGAPHSEAGELLDIDTMFSSRPALGRLATAMLSRSQDSGFRLDPKQLLGLIEVERLGALGKVLEIDSESAGLGIELDEDQLLGLVQSQLLGTGPVGDQHLSAASEIISALRQGDDLLELGLEHASQLGLSRVGSKSQWLQTGARALLHGDTDQALEAAAEQVTSRSMNAFTDWASKSLGGTFSASLNASDLLSSQGEAELATAFERRISCLSSEAEGECSLPVDLRLGVELDAVDLRLQTSGVVAGIQTHLELNQRETMELHEPDEWSLKVVFARGAQRAGETVDIERQAPCFDAEGSSLDCLQEELQAATQSSDQGQFAVSVEYADTSAFELVSSDGSPDVLIEPVEKLVGSLRYGRLLGTPGTTHVNRVDLQVSYEDISNEAKRRGRLLADFTFMRRLADRFSLLMHIQWANEPEFLIDRADTVSGRLAFSWAVGKKRGAGW